MQSRGKKQQKNKYRGSGQASRFLELDQMPLMSELLGEKKKREKSCRHHSADIGSEENLAKSSTEKETELKRDRDHISSRSHAGLELSDMSSMEDLLKGSPKCSLHSSERRAETDRADKPGSGSAKSSRTGRKRSSRTACSSKDRLRKVIIDGSNICRYEINCASEGSNEVSALGLLLKLTLYLAEQEIRFRCVFDASERFALARNSQWPHSETVYGQLLRDAPGSFAEVPGGQSADGMILQLATRENCPVISNDRFNKSRDGHLEQYPWLQVADRRLIRAQTKKEGTVFWPQLGFTAAPGGDPRILAEKLLGDLQIS